MAKAPAKSGSQKTASKNALPISKRVYLKQSDVPMTSLEYALRMPQAIFDHYAGKPVSALQLAKAIEMDPKGSQIRVLSGAAIAFGLVDGGVQAAKISVTELARKILRPRIEGEDLLAKREAVLLPRVFGDFLRRYDGHAFPRQDIAVNVLEEMGVPREKTAEVLERIDSSARSVGFIEEIRGKIYVSLQEVLKGQELSELDSCQVGVEAENSIRLPELPVDVNVLNFKERAIVPPPVVEHRGAVLSAAIADDQRRRRVFITHGKNRDLVAPIKKLLEYGELEPVISVERQSVSKPVPEKVMDDMRACGAAIIHVDADKKILDQAGQEHVLLNPNVLIEIGAAMAFYGRRFILLVKNGVKLPSNLQGLYEVRYDADNLDAHATIQLLEAMKDIKNHPLPTFESNSL